MNKRRPAILHSSFLRFCISFVCIVHGALCISVVVALPRFAEYEVYAVRFGTIPDFAVSGLVAGADRSRRLDIPVMVWVIKSPERVVLVDSGFYRDRFVQQWKVRDFVKPSDAIGAIGLKAEDVTDIIISHMHWDHADGADLFPKARVWIQRDEYQYYTGEAWQRPNGHGGVFAEDVQAIVGINTQGRVRFVEGDAQEILPGITCYTGGKHTYASQFVSVTTAEGTVVLTSDNVYLYENIDKHAAIAQTLDAASNLKAQERAVSLASDRRLIVPGHDPEVFTRYTSVAPNVVRIKR
jgi:glyoxylase-like metal-dependent hydrolase (beta-lactamase superfamily II)